MSDASSESEGHAECSRDAGDAELDSRAARDDGHAERGGQGERDAAEQHVVIGAGPAGLTAAWHLTRQARAVVVLEADPAHVGGLARTFTFAGGRFDLGPHRFYTKSAAIERLWQAMLPQGFVQVARLTRIYYRRRYFPYPLQVGATLRTIGVAGALHACVSYARARLFPRRPVASFEDWIVNHFGRALYRAFFKTYTEKVWGMPCASIDKDWAAQRIRGLSLAAALLSALRGTARATMRRSRRGSAAPETGGAKSLVSRFLYPPRGAGQLWETVRDAVVAAGGECRLGERVTRIRHSGGRVVAVETATGTTFAGTHFYATMPLAELIEVLDPPPPAAVLQAGRGLRYRDFLVVALLVARRSLFPDQWIYVHDPDVRVARITNFENWGDRVDGIGEQGPPAARTRLLLEYFCNSDEPLWQQPDEALVTLARAELERIALLPPGSAVEGTVVRVRRAYPVYDRVYREHRRVLRDWLRQALPNLAPAGRGGLHNYNSQDHAMMTATLAVRNQTEGTSFDVWAINTEEEYAEEGGIDGSLEPRLVPLPLAKAASGQGVPV